MKPLIFIFLLTSCSTLKRQQLFSGITGALIGGSLGAMIGKSLSPNQRSDQLNMILGGSIGALVGTVGGVAMGTYFWQEDPTNIPMENMMIKDDLAKTPPPPTQYKVLLPNNLKKIPIEGELPPSLKGKVKQGHVLTFEVPEYEEETEQGTIYHEAHQAFQYSIE
jgi:hypothetical protein